ncbi:MAG: polyprenyl synthetase family protein [Tannerella sp.]|jgi:geranylgeranyl pyrophosphate synthase|nr:polyprenyl synthetase family protein [Tannerella sp.]
MDKDLTKPEYGIPATVDERNRLRELIVRFIDDIGIVPPVTRKQLSDLSFQFIHKEALNPDFWGWLMVEMNNRIWNDTFAAIPYERRILLLPQCLKNSSVCTAEIDELGLLCRKCGHCAIAPLEDMAKKKGVLSIVAEGFTPVFGLFESGAVDAVIGVGCLESLEKVFPLLVDHAVPGMAIALNCAGCKDTHVDTDYVEKITGGFVKTQHTMSLQCDAENLKNEINQWFESDNLVRLLGDSSDHTSQIAREWLCGEGKRWRPFLLVSVFKEITGIDPVPETVKSAAIAVEAFHKASLIHDDIEDKDDMRYGKPTVNSLYGVPIAINVGDMLLGDGYRLLSECNKMELVQEAATAHIALCRGQGLELEWCRNPVPLKMDEVIHIIENKTVPAFGVALSFAVACAGGDETLKVILSNYAYSLGIAYQLLDDLADFQSETGLQLRPTTVLAAICEDCIDKSLIHKLLLQEDIPGWMNANKPLLKQAMERVTAMAETYKQQTLDHLSSLQNVELKRLLFRVTKKILK